MKHTKFLLFLLIIASKALLAQIPVLDIHFAVITKNPKAHRVATLAQLHKEVELLNTYFVTEHRKPIVRFRLKSSSFYDQVKHSNCEFVHLGDTTRTYSSDGWAELFNRCNDVKLKDPKAINFYIYDSYSEKRGFADQNGHGKRNSNRPYVLIDWERLDHKTQSPEEHEMGHALGLGHVCSPGAKQNSPTNIMSSADCGKGSGGLRDIGFDDEQVKTILHYVQKIIKKQHQTHE
jgi:hypothetical protein